MNLHEEQERVQKAVSNSLSHVQEDPWLAQRVLANAKGEEPVKRKISLALVLSIVGILAVMGTAYALFSSQVAEFFGQHWGHDYNDWLQGGKIAQIGETVTLGDVSFTLDEVVYRDRGIYAVGTARLTNDKDVLIPMDVADGWELEEVMQGDEAQSLIQLAKKSGGRMLSIDCFPERIGVDNGSMVNTGDVGAYNLRNEDGSITFSFETGGYALEDGTTYQLEMSIDVDEWTEAGMVENDPIEPQTWTVNFQPIIMTKTAAPETQSQIPAEALQQNGYAILVPASYQETGTMPVYQAVENDFMTTVQPEWFNQSGIAKEEKSRKSTGRTFNDHAELSVSSEAIWYDNGWSSGFTKVQSATLNRNAIAQAKNENASYQSEIDKAKREKIAEKERKRKEKNEKYWAAHSKEKEELLSERKELEIEVSTLSKMLTDIDAMDDIADIKDEIETLELEKKALGLFKKKEKKAIDEKITDCKAMLDGLSHQRKGPVQNQLDAKKKRIDWINNELTRDR